MSNKKFNYNKNIVAAFLVLKKNNKILLLRRQNTGYEDGNYGLISGHLEAGESFRTALIREAKEEANIIISSDKILATHIQHRKSLLDRSERVDAYFLVEEWKNKIKNLEPEKCSELTWFPIDDLPSNIILAVRSALENLFNNIFYSEFAWD